MSIVGELRLKIERARRTGKFPVWLREEVGAFVSQRLGSGETLEDLSKQLVMSPGILSRWQALSSELVVPGIGQMVPVRVEPQGAVQAVRMVSPAGWPKTVTVVSPAGWRIEGVPFELAWARLQGEVQ